MFTVTVLNANRKTQYSLYVKGTPSNTSDIAFFVHRNLGANSNRGELLTRNILVLNVEIVVLFVE